MSNCCFQCNSLVTFDEIFAQIIFVQFLAAKILITTGSSTTSEILYIYKRNKDQILSFSKSKPAKRFPNGNCVGAFGGICDGRIVVGFEKDVFEYEEGKDEWRQIQKEKDVQYDRISAQCCTLNQMLLIVSPKLGKRAELMKFEKPQKFENNILESGEGVTPSSLFQGTLSDVDTNKTISPSKQHHSNQSQEFLSPQNVCSTLLPVSVQSCTLTHLGKNQVMLIECKRQQLKAEKFNLCDSISSSEYLTKETTTLGCFFGTLVDIKGDEESQISNNKNLIWHYSKEFYQNALRQNNLGPSQILPDIYSVSSMQRRYDYIIFKMMNSVYVTGGFSATDRPLLSCVYFDLVLMSWFTSSHSLPYHLSNASVVVASDELFAVITGGKKDPGGPEEQCSNEIIVFTENDGFKVLKNSNLLAKRSSHVSIMIP